MVEYIQITIGITAVVIASAYYLILFFQYGHLLIDSALAADQYYYEEKTLNLGKHVILMFISIGGIAVGSAFIASGLTSRRPSQEQDRRRVNDGRY